MLVSWNVDATVQTGVIISTIERVDANGTPWIRMPDGRRAAAQLVAGITNATLAAAATARTPVVLALAGDELTPIILGILATEAVAADSPADQVEAEIDGKRVTLRGEEEVTLRCGRASITLTKAGKILIRGTYLTSRSSGVNRIKGGSVQIN
jgi:hypothetical protein